MQRMSWVVVTAGAAAIAVTIEMRTGLNGHCTFPLLEAETNGSIHSLEFMHVP